jgi:hypothetical protein
MHSETSRFSLGAFLQKRPWIWVVVGYCAFIVAISAAVTIAVKHREPSVSIDVPAIHGR